MGEYPTSYLPVTGAYQPKTCGIATENWHSQIESASHLGQGTPTVKWADEINGKI